MNLALLAVAVLWTSQPANLIRWARADIEVIGFWRLALAAAALAPFAWSVRASWTALGRRERLLHLAAGTLFFLHLWTYVYAAQNTLVANAMAAFCTNPLLVGLGAWLAHDERPTPRLAAGYLLAALGVWALLSGSVSLAGGRLAGDLAALASAAFFAGYVLVGRRLRRGLDNRAYACGVYAVTALLFGLTGLARGVEWVGHPPSFWAAVGALGLGVTLGGHALFTYLLDRLDVNLMTTAKLLEPVFGAGTAWLVFGETLAPRTLVAFVFIASAVAVVASGPKPAGPLSDEG